MMSREDAAALVRTLLDAAGRGDLARLASLYAEDAVAVSPVFGTVCGREQIVATWRELLATFLDLQVDIADILVDGDRVAVLSTVSTMDRAGWFGRAPTGGPINYRLVLLLTVVGGAIVRDERIYDSAGVVERLEKSRLDKELRLAADVQRALLGRRACEQPFVDVIGDSIPCRAIGGDCFDFAELPSGGVAVWMADVSGKGPAAALLAAMIQGMLAVEATSGERPAVAVSRINRQLAARRLDGRFATLVYGMLSSEGRFVYSNAGHNAPALLTRGGVRRLTTGGPILGAFDEASFEEESCGLDSGDRLVMFTDGVTEARSSEDEEYGEGRLLACIGDRPASPTALLNRILSSVRDFTAGAEPTDDVTVVVAEYRAP